MPILNEEKSSRLSSRVQRADCKMDQAWLHSGIFDSVKAFADWGVRHSSVDSGHGTEFFLTMSILSFEPISTRLVAKVSFSGSEGLL